MTNTLWWWCRLTDCASFSLLNALVASDLYFLFFHGQMSKLFLMALTERLGSGLEHQLPAAKALAVLRFHHVRSFIRLRLEAVANRTVLLGWHECRSLVRCCAGIAGWVQLDAFSQLFVFNLVIPLSMLKNKLCLLPKGQFETHTRQAQEKRRVWRRGLGKCLCPLSLVKPSSRET